MGANMARRLHECGHKVAVVHDLRPRVAAELAAELGCETSRSLPKITELADVIFTVVSDDTAMDLLFGTGSKGLLHKAKGRLFVNCATLSPRTHMDVETRALKAGAQTLEACMASSIPQARNGHLYLMCSGERTAFDRALPLLKKLGTRVQYFGQTGEAAKIKALVNMVMNINTAGLAEGLALGEALGLDLGLLRQVFADTGAASRVLETDGEDMQNREHTCFFSAAHAAKDSAIALTLARQQRLNLPLATATFKQYRKMVRNRLGDLDKSGIAELTFRDRGGLKLPPQRGPAN